ncbi:hypothetical protein C453_17484 [Haloferax elongans ATCC BAA-1513]|uniref:Cupin type-2 domain-containing protein n=1 Tax=Haloferax elongans ATCC BAA-1513 TaxID=1230453 RepID=M0HB99_HALEO|nr:cupin domain-containing protein [Haloferax elongans]ELZ81831.1 hypothetical protein C453_17484 [Haloferax elongans ATCC BAA-1513]
MSQHATREFSNAQHLQVLGALISVTAGSDDTDGEYTVLDMLVPPRFENGLHTHAPSEVFHVIEGEARLHVDGVDQTLSPGMSGYVGSEVPHGFANETDEVCRVIAVMSPGGSEAFFVEAGVPADGRTLPEPQEVTDEQLQELFAIGEQYGFEFLGPLPA